MTSTPQSDPETPRFSFPFRDAAGKEIVDEHVIHEWLTQEPTGSFAVSGSAMWHGGIHVSANGTGRHIDLMHGIRCLCKGQIVAYRMNRAPLESHIAASGNKPAVTSHYSSAFALVRHMLDYPAGNVLPFFSLYMHLQSVAEYQAGMEIPAYWVRAYEVSQYASDHPKATPHHPHPRADTVGLNIHERAGNHVILGILPRGAKVRIGERSQDGKWGQIDAIEPGTPMPPEVAGYVRDGAAKGWVFLGKERGHVLLTPAVSTAQCDQVIVPSKPIDVDAGDLMGHLGRYWSPDDPSADNRMVHIEVFCGDGLDAFLDASRPVAEDLNFDKCSLLRIDKGVKLFAGPSVSQEGANAPTTGVVQIYNQATLDALPADCKGAKDDFQGDGQPWWKITSANSRLEDITGWVRNRQMPSGRVTREAAQNWIDFEPVKGDGGGNPTIFSTVDAWLDHMLCEDKPATGDVGKLKPLACGFYRALSPVRNESRAADEMRRIRANKWLALRASRLMPKHHSEWASESMFQEFFAKVLACIEHDPVHDAELERAKRLMWWDSAAQGGIKDFPASPVVYHIHPIALVGNFLTSHGARENDFTEADAKEALKLILAKYGRGIAETVERMYRTETRHFQSMQYRRCGTGGMEVHGAAPFYGWNPDFYSEEPTGTWSSYEGVGLSQVGGNQQITSRKKEFVVVSSVAVGMEFKARYIVHYGGNYARWFSTSPDQQAVYRHTIESITPKIVNSLP